MGKWKYHNVIALIILSILSSRLFMQDTVFASCLTGKLSMEDAVLLPVVLLADYQWKMCYHQLSHWQVIHARSYIITSNK